MERKLLLHKLFVLAVIVAAVFVLAACKKEPQKKEPVEETVLQPSPTPVATEVPQVEPTQEASKISTVEYVSTTDLFSAKVPAGWTTEEIVPGAGFVIANSETALERYKADSAVGSGDFVLNIGFLPLALLQEKQLSHLGFQLNASPEATLQSLLPLFRIGDEPAGSVAGEATRVSLSDLREAGMLTLSDMGREGMILMFVAGDGVLAFVSAEASPGEFAEYQELTYALAAEVVYSGAQDALYAALYGG